MVGSREEALINKVKTRARQYPWGTVEGEESNPSGEELLSAYTHSCMRKKLALCQSQDQTTWGSQNVSMEKRWPS